MVAPSFPFTEKTFLAAISIANSVEFDLLTIKFNHLVNKSSLKYQIFKIFINKETEIKKPPAKNVASGLPFGGKDYVNE
jgi:hypothetical protein